eukprot:g67800.t1
MLAQRDFHATFDENYLNYKPGTAITHTPSLSAVLFAAPDVANAWREALPESNPFSTHQGGRVTRVANSGADLHRALMARGDVRACMVLAERPLPSEASSSGFEELWLPLRD